MCNSCGCQIRKYCYLQVSHQPCACQQQTSCSPCYNGCYNQCNNNCTSYGYLGNNMNNYCSNQMCNNYNGCNNCNGNIRYNQCNNSCI